MHAHFDLVVIGSGPAGEKGGARAAYFGKKVALVERAAHLGGAGVNTGTIPSKTLRETALYFSGLRQRGLYGIDYSLKDGVTVAEFMHRERAVVENERALIAHNLERHKIELIRGSAEFAADGTVTVAQADGATRQLSADVYLIATGSVPNRPSNIPFDDEVVFDSDSILRMSRLPKSIIVVGGGTIGTEYAALFTALGIEVTQVASSERLLAFVDREITERLQAHLQGLGLKLVFNARMTKVERDPRGVTLTLQDGRSLNTDLVLFAAGRKGNIAGLGLEKIGVKVDEHGLIVVDEQYRTSVPGVYAAGDVIGFPALASTSMEQGRVAMTHAFNLPSTQHVAAVSPLAVYSIPEVAMVGLTEEACIEQQVPYLVGRAYYANNPRGQIIGDTAGMLKLIFSPHDLKLLGVHHLGELASELVHIGSEVVAEGGTINAFIDAVYNYPSLADSYKYAAYEGLGKRDAWLAEHPGVAAS